MAPGRRNLPQGRRQPPNKRGSNPSPSSYKWNKKARRPFMPSWTEMAVHTGTLIMGRPLSRNGSLIADGGTMDGGDEAPDLPGFTIFLFFGWIIGCGTCIWGWCVWLEYRPAYEKVRSCMLAALAVLTALELSLCMAGQLSWWMTWLLVLVNGWGYLDAVLRFPVVHGIDTLFALKHFLLLALKVVSLIFGFQSIARSKLWFFVLLVVNILAMPICYLFALPIDESEAVQREAAHDVVDEDIALRLFGLATSGEERRRCVQRGRRLWHRCVTSLARSSPAAAAVIERVLPETSRGPALREARRRSV